jgi:hypothetical protein
MTDTPVPKKPAAKRTRKAPAKKTPAKKASASEPIAPVETPQEEQRLFIRNMSGVPFRIKLHRHTAGQGGIQLKPRGERGDISPLEKGDTDDIVLKDNIALGLIELVAELYAIQAIEKQSTNQQAPHSALAALRNEKGEGGLTVSMEKSAEEQGVTVASLEDGQIVFDPGKGGPSIRRPGEAPGVPANIPGAEPGIRPANEEASFLSDLRKNVQVNPVQKGNA